MADIEVEETIPNEAVDSNTDSQQSSVYGDWWHGEEEQNNKENTETNALPRQNSTCSNDSRTTSSGQLILSDGVKLAEESGTESTGLVNLAFESSGGSSRNGEVNGSRYIIPEIPPRQPSGPGKGTARHRALKSGNIVSSIPEVEITIPNNGNLAEFSADDMATLLRYLRLEDRLINHLHRNGLDGRRFGRLKDSDLDNLKLNNPVVVYFRDRTAPAVAKIGKNARPRLPFVL